MESMVPFVRIVVGLALLLLGRRLYWLLVAGIGFLTGMELAQWLLPGRPEWVFLVLALGLALVGTLAATVAQLIVSGVGQSLHLSSQSALVALVVIAVIGAIVQAGWLGAAPRRRH